MIRSVTVINHREEVLTMELGKPDETGFLITDIEGIGPGTAEINTTELSATDGSIFNSSRIPSRNIVISIQYLSNRGDIETIRHRSYRYFPLKKDITLIFETDERLLSIDGYVESNDPDIFSKEESTQISIICPDPYFYSLSSNVTVFSGVEPLFEFPFSNESLTDDLLEMGEIRTKYENTIYYEGDAEVGVTIVIHALGEAEGITIYNVLSQERMKIDTDKLKTMLRTESGIVAGDDIIINTETGNKSIVLNRSGVEHNILNCLDKDTDWFKLQLGENVFSYTADNGASNLRFSIYNNTLFEGV